MKLSSVKRIKGRATLVVAGCLALNMFDFDALFSMLSDLNG
ncbi:hypothetical protein O9992_29835 [Vibrio lentus]|nr:hypothetical protein [Vibrio lentus]